MARVAGQRRFVVDQRQGGWPRFVGAAGEFEEDPQPGAVVRDVPDSLGSVRQAKSVRRCCKVRARALAAAHCANVRSRIFSNAADAAVGQDAARPPCGDAPVSGCLVDGPQLHVTNIRAPRTEVSQVLRADLPGLATQRRRISMSFIGRRRLVSLAIPRPQLQPSRVLVRPLRRRTPAVGDRLLN